MVRIRRAEPDILYAYLTSPVPLSVLDHIHAQFAIGTFARFNPSCELFIHDRPEFYSLSHLAIRQQLDADGFLSPFLIIEDRTRESNALWYIETTESGLAAEENTEAENLVKHGDEVTLLRIRLLIPDVGMLHSNLDVGGTSTLETLDQWPYDPHADQEPYTLGMDFEKQSWFPAAYIAATEEEVEFTDDLELRKMFVIGWGNPDWLISLKDDVALREGLTTDWSVKGELNENREFTFQVKFDAKSLKWRSYVPLQH